MTKNERFEAFFRILNQWMFLRENGVSLEEYFHMRNIKKIAIYDMGNMAGHLIAELKNSDVDICYIYDKSGREYDYGIPVASNIEELQKIDALVVIEKDIVREIQLKISEAQMTTRVICLEQIVFGVAV